MVVNSSLFLFSGLRNNKNPNTIHAGAYRQKKKPSSHRLHPNTNTKKKQPQPQQKDNPTQKQTTTQPPLFYVWKAFYWGGSPGDTIKNLNVFVYYSELRTKRENCFFLIYFITFR